MQLSIASGQFDALVLFQIAIASCRNPHAIQALLPLIGLDNAPSLSLTLQLNGGVSLQDWRR
jgi:hypothetical protein